MEWIAEGRVRVDGKRAPKGSPVQAGARISVERPPPDQPAPQPELPIRIVHADAHLVVADKPAGMPSHPLKPGERGTAANALVGRFPELAQVGPSPREGGLVHRLDSDTSGLLLAARTDAAHAMLRAQFAARTVEKGYLALVAGEIHAGGEIAVPLLHDPRDPRRMQAASDAAYAEEHGARPAVTRFEPVERRGGFTLLDVEIPTGVMHQIRAHLAFIGHALAGDALYGGPVVAGLGRHFLHAARLAFGHPDGSRARYESALPPDLAAVLAGLQSRARAGAGFGARAGAGPDQARGPVLLGYVVVSLEAHPLERLAVHVALRFLLQVAAAHHRGVGRGALALLRGRARGHPHADLEVPLAGHLRHLGMFGAGRRGLH